MNDAAALAAMVADEFQATYAGPDRRAYLDRLGTWLADLGGVVQDGLTGPLAAFGGRPIAIRIRGARRPRLGGWRAHRPPAPARRQQGLRGLQTAMDDERFACLARLGAWTPITDFLDPRQCLDRLLHRKQHCRFEL